MLRLFRSLCLFRLLSESSWRSGGMSRPFVTGDSPPEKRPADPVSFALDTDSFVFPLSSSSLSLLSSPLFSSPPLTSFLSSLHPCHLLSPAVSPYLLPICLWTASISQPLFFLLYLSTSFRSSLSSPTDLTSTISSLLLFLLLCWSRQDLHPTQCINHLLLPSPLCPRTLEEEEEPSRDPSQEEKYLRTSCSTLCLGLLLTGKLFSPSLDSSPFSSSNFCSCDTNDSSVTSTLSNLGFLKKHHRVSFLSELQWKLV